MISDEMKSGDGVAINLQIEKKFKFVFEAELYFSDIEDITNYLNEVQETLEDEFNAKNISIEEVVPDTK